MFLYGFFDYKYDLNGFTSDLFSRNHIIFLIIAFISIVLIGIFAKKIKKKSMDIFFKIFAIVISVLEITKITWESYYDITRGFGFNYGGILPLYTCSLLIYCAFVVGFGKGKAKDIALTWMSTIGMITGFIIMIYPNGLNWYPVLTFGGMHSLLFHFSMAASGVLILASGYKKLNWKDIYLSLIPMLILEIIVIPFDYIFKVDYMQIYGGDGIPLMEDFASFLAKYNLRFIFTIIMTASYMALSLLSVGIYKYIRSLVYSYKYKKNRKVIENN